MNFVAEKKIIDLPESSKLRANVVFSMTGDVQQEIDFKLHFNQESNTYLGVYKFMPIQESALSVGAIILLDENFEPLNQSVIETSNPGKHFVMENIRPQRDGSFVMTVIEKERNFSRAGSPSLVYGTSIVYIGDEDEEARFLEIVPTQTSIRGMHIGSQIDKNNNLIYAVASCENNNAQFIDLNVYRYDIKKDQLDNEVIKLNFSDLNPKLADNYITSLHQFRLDDIVVSEDGAIYVILTGTNSSYTQAGKQLDYGTVIMKLDHENNTEWIQYFENYKSGVNGDAYRNIAFIDEDGNLALLCNMTDAMGIRLNSAQTGTTYTDSYKTKYTKLKHTKKQLIHVVTFDGLSGEYIIEKLIAPKMRSAIITVPYHNPFKDELFEFSVYLGKKKGVKTYILKF